METGTKQITLLPTAQLSALAFDAAVVECHVFPLRPLDNGPAEVLLDWYLECTNVGHAIWVATVVPIPPGPGADIPLIAPCRNGWRPMVTEPDRMPDRSVTLPVDFSACDDAALLIIYRDSPNAYDTAYSDGVITHVRVSWRE